ncbi:MAG: hypothetical protein WC962_03430 [Phycisphaerae bacterium]
MIENNSEVRPLLERPAHLKAMAALEKGIRSDGLGHAVKMERKKWEREWNLHHITDKYGGEWFFECPNRDLIEIQVRLRDIIIEGQDT